MANFKKINAKITIQSIGSCWSQLNSIAGLTMIEVMVAIAIAGTFLGIIFTYGSDIVKSATSLTLRHDIIQTRLYIRQNINCKKTLAQTALATWPTTVDTQIQILNDKNEPVIAVLSGGASTNYAGIPIRAYAGSTPGEIDVRAFIVCDQFIGSVCEGQNLTSTSHVWAPIYREVPFACR